MKGRPLAGAAAIAIAAWAIATVVVLADGDVKVTPVVTDGKVSASFAAPAAFDADAGEVVKTGLPLTFTFLVELRRPSFWIDRTITSTTLASSVKYDNLTRVYTVSKLQENRVIWANHTDVDATMRTWATTFDAVKLESTEKLEPNVEYYVRVQLRATPRRSVWPWPFAREDASGRAAFTFIR